MRKYFAYEGHKLKRGNPSRNILVRCNLCVENYHRSYTEGSTSNLIRHLENQIFEAFQAVKLEGTRKSDQISILDFCEGGSKKLPPNDPKQKRFDEAVLNLLASNRASFHALNTDEFKDIVNIADPKLTVKSQQAMLKQMSKIVKTKVLPDIRKELNTIDAATISLDLWTSHRKDGVWQLRFYILIATLFGK
ncbi:unnamed protein product [Allacma fusca]|uniref:BED-type domain-containing protein n=1 Tax=Allacma fusca TaxID=39272 RepID=A0A8J2PVR0_9HEXA|nr:unnamed protein product [Allacma fusca]